jgi:hypothetical protein
MKVSLHQLFDWGMQGVASQQHLVFELSGCQRQRQKCVVWGLRMVMGQYVKVRERYWLAKVVVGA